MTSVRPNPVPATEAQYPLAPSTLSAEVYRDPQRYRRELDTVLYDAWYPVAPSADLAATGDYVVWDQLEQSVAIVRQADGSVSAWHNVCQHRGARLLEASGHCAGERIRCPWHGFGYDLDGVVRAVPLRNSFDEERLAGMRAPRVRSAEWGGWVWLTLSPATPELTDYLGAVGELLAGYGLDGWTTRFRHSVTLKANWKIVVDAFNETWHVPFTHQGTLNGVVRWREAALKIEPPHSWMTLPVKGLSDRVESDDPRANHICHYLVFPNTIFSCFPHHLQMWSAWPISVDETLLCAYGVVGPAPAGVPEEKWTRSNQRDWSQFLDVLVEDADVIDGFTRTVRSRGFREVVFNTAEGRLTAFHAEVAARLGED
jgi:choline monooxygenase